jgi:hypothetical protein
MLLAVGQAAAERAVAADVPDRPAAKATAAAAEPLWELAPYRVQLWSAVAAGAHLPQDAPQAVGDGVRQRVETVVGAAWQIEAAAVAEPRLRQRMATALAELGADDLPPGSGFDKVLLLAVREQAGEYLVEVREWDQTARAFGPVHQRRAARPGALADEAFRAVLAAFSPVAEIESVQGSDVRLRLRAAALPSRDPGLNALAAGDVLRPIVRRADPYGKASGESVATVPWTYLLVKEAAGGALSAQLHSGIRSPLATNRRSRNRQFALAVGRPRGETTLALVAADGSGRPLEGYDVFARAPEETALRLVGRSDQAGRVRVPAAGHPLQILSVKHGSQLVARLPVVAGLTAQASAELVDDDARLEAEGRVMAIQETLVDAVTRRGLLVAQVEARLKAGDYDRARRLLDELKRLPNRQQLLFEIDEHQRRLTAAQPQATRQLERMFGDTRKVLSQHLDPRVIDELELQLSRSKVAASASSAPGSRMPEGTPRAGGMVQN